MKIMTFRINTLIITPLSLRAFSITLQSAVLSISLLIIIEQRVVMHDFCNAECLYDESRYAECCNTEWLYAECRYPVCCYTEYRYAEFIMLNFVIKPYVLCSFMPLVILMIVAVLNVVAPNNHRYLTPNLGKAYFLLSVFRYCNSAQCSYHSSFCENITNIFTAWNI